jgi:histidine triad (HIT) family protein
MMVFAQPVARAIQQAVPCRKVGVSVIGLEVPHAHIHLLPLQTVSDMNFEKAKLAPTPEALAAMASRIRAAM